MSKKLYLEESLHDGVWCPNALLTLPFRQLLRIHAEMGEGVRNRRRLRRIKTREEADHLYAEMGIERTFDLNNIEWVTSEG